jgi:predicted RNase H-like nuclease
MPLSGGMRKVLMRKVLGETWFAGVDGCRAGWVVAFLRPQGGEVRLRVVPRFAEVIAAPEAPAIISVDIPIGLPEQAGRGGRTADNAVRSLLGARRSSVFSVPSRRAVFAEVGPFYGQQSRCAAHQRACAIARETSVPPRSITIYAFAIFSKIREVDAVLQSDRALDGRVHETHPELAFWRLNGARPLASAKKTEAGLALRRRLLIEAGLAPGMVNGAPPKGAGPDDLLDALACAAIAARICRGLAQPFPDPPERDACGLPMAISA